MVLHATTHSWEFSNWARTAIASSGLSFEGGIGRWGRIVRKRRNKPSARSVYILLSIRVARQTGFLCEVNWGRWWWWWWWGFDVGEKTNCNCRSRHSRTESDRKASVDLSKVWLSKEQNEWTWSEVCFKCQKMDEIPSPKDLCAPPR